MDVRIGFAIRKLDDRFLLTALCPSSEDTTTKLTRDIGTRSVSHGADKYLSSNAWSYERTILLLLLATWKFRERGVR